MLLLSAPRRARWLGRLLKGLPGFLAFLQSSNDNPLGTDDYQKPGSFPSFLNFIGESLLAFPMSHIPPYFRWAFRYSLLAFRAAAANPNPALRNFPTSSANDAACFACFVLLISVFSRVPFLIARTWACSRLSSDSISARLFFILQIVSNSHYQRPVDCSVLEEVAEKIQAYCHHNHLLLLDPFHDPGNCKLFQSSFPVGHMSALSEGEDCLHRLAREMLRSVSNISLQNLENSQMPELFACRRMHL